MKTKINFKLPAIIFVLTFAIATGVLFSNDFFLKKPITTTPRATDYTCADRTETVEEPCGAGGTRTCSKTFQYIPDEQTSYNTCVDHCKSTFKTQPPPPEAEQECINECAPSHCYTGALKTVTCGDCRLPPEDKTPPPPPPTNTPIPTNTTTPPTPTLTKVPNTPTPTMTGVPPTNTPTPSATGVPPTNTPIPTATLTPVPNACGYTQCDTQHPCNGGLICVTAKNDKSYCAKPEYQDACKNNPTTDSCCNAPAPTNTPQPGPTNTPVPPTEIIIAKGGPTNTPPAPTIPTVGTPIHWIIIAAPILLVTLGLLF